MDDAGVDAGEGFGVRVFAVVDKRCAGKGGTGGIWGSEKDVGCCGRLGAGVSGLGVKYGVIRASSIDNCRPSISLLTTSGLGLRTFRIFVPERLFLFSTGRSMDSVGK